jgi:hypothetical protein
VERGSQEVCGVSTYLTGNVTVTKKRKDENFILVRYWPYLHELNFKYFFRINISHHYILDLKLFRVCED